MVLAFVMMAGMGMIARMTSMNAGSQADVQETHHVSIQTVLSFVTVTKDSLKMTKEIARVSVSLSLLFRLNLVCVS